MYVSISLDMEVSFSSAAICSSARLRSRRTLCAASWLFQKLGSATRASRTFRRSRYWGASKIAPHERGALFEPFVAMLEIFDDHTFSRKTSVAERTLICLSKRYRHSNNGNKPAAPDEP